jgi:hypothetical protein
MNMQKNAEFGKKPTFVPESSIGPDQLAGEISEKIQNEMFRAWTARIENKLDFAESMSTPRTQWPQELNKFPIKYFKILQNIFLKVLSALFRDQRQVNCSLVQALRESLVFNRTLMDQINALSVRIKHLEQPDQTAVGGDDHNK